MKTGPARRNIINTLLAAGLLMMVTPCAFSDAEDSPGWTQQYIPSDEPWKEQQAELPAYPEKGNLLEVNISTGGLPYKLYIDTLSVRPGDDLVVRYTVVMISSTGIWNISNEGLHCGEKRYRRYAYGYDGEWRRLEDSPWSPVSGLGVNQYRKIFYSDYMCNQAQPYMNARQIIEKIRSSDYGYEE
jgi:hypothetical protein